MMQGWQQQYSTGEHARHVCGSAMPVVAHSMMAQGPKIQQLAVVEHVLVLRGSVD